MKTVRRKIVVDRDRCTGCQLCEIECSFLHEGGFQPDAARIRIQPREGGRSPFPLLCLHCESAECAFVCPTGARRKEVETGQVIFEEDKCVHCKMCLLACPHAGPIDVQEEERLLFCDFCGGQPACVEACPKGALSLRDLRPIQKALFKKDDLLSPGLGSCQGCTAEWAVRFTVQVFGPNTVVGIPPCCMAGIVGFGTGAGAKIPVVFTLLPNTAAMMAGVKHHFLRQKRDVQVVAVAGDGGTADIGLQSLSAAAERGDNIIYICYDNEAYMNTGIQRSGTTPLGSWTATTPLGEAGRGKKQMSKDLPMIMLAHNIPYMATASPSYPEDYLAKLEKAKQVKEGLVYIHILTPCQTGWQFSSEKGMEIGRLAVETNYFPLWEAVDGNVCITKKVDFPKPIEAFTRMMGRYKHLTRQEISVLQERVDARYQRLVALSKSIKNKGESLQAKG
jgi:phenylglyoxylate dehydrogenase beta subunit